MDLSKIKVLKKDQRLEGWDSQKIVRAIRKSAERAAVELSDTECDNVVNDVLRRIEAADKETVGIEQLHVYVELALDSVSPDTAKQYRGYRNYKKESAERLQKIWQSDQRRRFLGDKENANKDSALVATKQALLRSDTSRELYLAFDADVAWRKAHDEGFIYIHDIDSRRDTFNCCLFDMGNVMKRGFEMANMRYTEPNSLKTAFSVMGDVVLSAAAQQYGGFTIPQIDKILSPYAEKTYQASIKKYNEKLDAIVQTLGDASFLTKPVAWVMDKMRSCFDGLISQWAEADVKREFTQGWQGFEYKFNTVGSSRGDYPFITVSLGLAKDRWGKLCNLVALENHKNGQGEPGKKRPVLFPKYVFLYDKALHGEGGPLEDVFNAAIECSEKVMYPDYLSMTGEGYISNIYKTYGEVISPMGCRAFLSPYWREGGLKKADEADSPVYEGRFNIGVVSLNLPLIYLTARKEGKDFYELLDFYMQMIREIHLYTYNYLAQMPASVNPLAFCEGGFYNPLDAENGGKHGLNPDDRIEPFLRAATASFGITALNELQMAYNGKSLAEDGEFALEVMRHINDVVNGYKEQDGRLYAIYGTPAESLCGKQARALKEHFGIIPGVSDKDYVSNSFHCAVWEDITGPEKQDLEARFWEMFGGGKIQYCRYPLQYNKNAVRALVTRAMDMGLYEGVNMEVSYCNDCGYSGVEIGDTCPHCGGKSITSISRMNGYLAYSRVSVRQADGSYRSYSRLNDAKMAEIKDRKSM
jgi:ribonucleoside-triphosphate reductase